MALLKRKMIEKEYFENKWNLDGTIHNRPFPMRKLRENELNDNNIISVFESSLTRIIGIPKDTLTDALMVVQVYYFDVFKDLSFYGFTYKGEKYRYFTSSAGQIRKKKAVFIKESIWNNIEKTVMCGLTIEKINSKGGNNVNKHLAYMALANSATDKWDDFDIDRCIVINDFETNVKGRFDFIDETDYSITETDGEVPITHTDGAGMMLPSVMTKIPCSEHLG
nr:RNA dependent RNA polymerase [Clostridium sp. AM45-5]